MGDTRPTTDVDAANPAPTETRLTPGGIGSDTPRTDSAASAETLDDIGGFSIDRELGRGAFGVVYLGRDPRIDRPVAIKVLQLGGRFDVERVLAEARAQGAVESPHVVPIHHVDARDDGTWFVVSRYLPGGTLQDRMRSAERVTVRRAVEWCAQIADGLHAAHRSGLVHRDLKPANVLLDEDGHALVGDFGLALHESEQAVHRHEVSGSPAYMAPEQVHGRSHHLDGRADIWALGVLLYELLAGRRPFGGATQEELFEEIASREPKPLRVVNPEIPAELEAVVGRCLRKPITERYATAADVARDLRRWLSGGANARHREILRAAALPTIVVIAAIAIAVGRPWDTGDSGSADAPGRGESTAPATMSSPANPVRPRIDVRVWGEGKSGLSIDDPRALPIRNGDQVRVEVDANRPTHVFVVWVDANGDALELYPNDPELGRLDTGPRQRVESPRETERGWPVVGESGTDTLFVLTCEQPLPSDESVAALVALPPAPLATDGVVRFVSDAGGDSRVGGREVRGLGGRSTTLDDPVREVLTRLRGRFDSVEILRVPHAASDEEPRDP